MKKALRALFIFVFRLLARNFFCSSRRNFDHFVINDKIVKITPESFKFFF